MAKISKNAKVAQRGANAGSGRDFVKVIKSIKDPVTGKYTYKQLMVQNKDLKNIKLLMRSSFNGLLIFYLCKQLQYGFF